jgi:hypothetical protein
MQPRIKQMKANNPTIDEINDQIRDLVAAELPRPVGGFETDKQEDEWRIASVRRFFQLIQWWAAPLDGGEEHHTARVWAKIAAAARDGGDMRRYEEATEAANRAA